MQIRKKQLYAIYDKKTETWSNPFVHITRLEAIRSFTDAVNKQNEQSLIYAHPEDFDLWLIGEYNEVDGVIDPKKDHIGNGLDYKQEQVH